MALPNDETIEKLMTFQAAAAALGVKYFHIQRAARQGTIPTYSIYNKRKLVRMSEVIAVINQSRTGGGDQ